MFGSILIGHRYPGMEFACSHAFWINQASHISEAQPVYVIMGTNISACSADKNPFRNRITKSKKSEQQ